MMKVDLKQVLTMSMNDSAQRPTQIASASESNTKLSENSALKSSVGLHLSISPMGLQKSKKADRDKDIEESDLPDNVKQSLKAIRDQQEELEKKRQELQILMRDDSMPPEEKQQAIQLLQLEISSLSLAVNDAKSNLLKSMQDQELTEEQIQKAMALMN